MDRLRITGGKKLSGMVQVSGSKNASLPILFASLLSEGSLQFDNLPDLSDIETTVKLLTGVGAKCSRKKSAHQLKVQAKKITSIDAPYDLVRTMRASVLILAPLLVRRKEARVSLPGGCAIGARPVDLHLHALEALGAKFVLEEGYIHGSLPHGTFIGTEFHFPFPSVGATESALMAAAFAKGKSIIHNVAREPEIVDLARFLNKLGAKITGAGTSKITVVGANKIPTKNIKHTMIPDRIEAATFWIAGMMTGGAVGVKIPQADVASTLKVLKQMGAKVQNKKGCIWVGASKKLKSIQVSTAPFPGFPTDVQAQLMALMTQAEGTSKVKETIFENRFMHVPELVRLGGEFQILGNEVQIFGPSKLQGAIVMATDLRASASLIIAALAAEKTTLIRRIYHLDRGYEKIEKKLSKLGASIKREKDV